MADCRTFGGMSAKHKLQVKYVSVATLVANPNNARQHSSSQVQQIAESIGKFGFNNPLLVDGDGVLIAGHGRLEAAKLLGLKDVPVINLAHLTAEERRAFALADNKIGLNATWNMDLLTKELAFLDSIDFDLGATGFSDKEIDDLLKSTNALLEAAPVTLPSVSPLADMEDDEDEAGEPEDGWLADDADAEEDEPAPQVTPAPKPSDANYSKFELVMEHTNKLLVVESLNNIRQDRHFEKLEDALVWLVKIYNEGKLEG